MVIINTERTVDKDLRNYKGLQQCQQWYRTRTDMDDFCKRKNILFQAHHIHCQLSDGSFFHCFTSLSWYPLKTQRFWLGLARVTSDNQNHETKTEISSNTVTVKLNDKH